MRENRKDATGNEKTFRWRLFVCSEAENKNCTFAVVDAQGCHEIDIRRKQKVMCKKGEPGKRLSAGTTYYTSESRICKYSNVTKIDVNFCEKGTE